MNEPTPARSSPQHGGDTGSAPGRGSHDEHRHGRDTRARIQQVALELFAERGYEKTSLREIAERLGVTKAALYYHFRSKEDIVASLAGDYFAHIDELIAWARKQPPGAGLQRELLGRYVTIVAEGSQVFRMLHQNQASVNTLAAAKNRGELFRERMHSLIDLLTGPGAPHSDRLRAAMALGGISVGLMFFADQVSDSGQLSEQVHGIAFQLLQADPAQQPPARAAQARA